MSTMLCCLLFAVCAEGCIQALLQRGADLEAASKQGRTAQFLAAISGQPAALAALIRAGAQVRMGRCRSGVGGLRMPCARAVSLCLTAWCDSVGSSK